MTTSIKGKAMMAELTTPELMVHHVIGEDIMRAFAARDHLIRDTVNNTGVPKEFVTKLVDGYIRKISEAYEKEDWIDRKEIKKRQDKIMKENPDVIVQTVDFEGKKK